jgi:asparagine synthase (glutamine-hydrolysing)
LRWHTLRKHPKYFSDDGHFINPDLVQRYNVASKINFREETQRLLKTSRELHHFDLSWSARQHDFENLDGVASAFKLDLRHPFSDRRLVEFCLALPPEQKIRGGYTRAILRYALASSLPEKIKTRVGKADLDLAFYYGIRVPERMDLGKILFHEPQLTAKYVDITLLREAYDDFMRGNNKNAAFLWRAAFLELWLQHQTSHADR